MANGRTGRWLTTSTIKPAQSHAEPRSRPAPALWLALGIPLFWSGEARADKTKIDAVLSGAVSAGDVPGIVALAADDKGVFYEGAFGKRNLVTGAAMTPDTMFWIASMTKAVTSVAAMQMVEQGKLNLRQADQRRRDGVQRRAGVGGL